MVVLPAKLRLVLLGLLALSACSDHHAAQVGDGMTGGGAAPPAGARTRTAGAGAASPARMPPEPSAQAGGGAEDGTAGSASAAGRDAASGTGGTAVVAGSRAIMTGEAGEAGAAAAAGDPDEGSSACLDGIDDYRAAGPFSYRTTTAQQVKLWVPEVPAGCKVPMVHFANGTGATCASSAAVLEHLASHGFLVACYESSNTGTGTQCVTAFETALGAYPELARMKAGSAGHGTGGGAALLCLNHARQRWGESLQLTAHGSQPDLAGLPGGWPEQLAQVAAPIAIFNGSEDPIVSENTTRKLFDALDPALEAYWHEGVGAPHIPAPARWMNESMVAWFRWQLLDDTSACRHFQSLPDTADWDLKAQRNPRGC